MIYLLFLYRYLYPEEMMNHIGPIEYRGMTTNTPAALVARILRLFHCNHLILENRIETY